MSSINNVPNGVLLALFDGICVVLKVCLLTIKIHLVLIELDSGPLVSDHPDRRHDSTSPIRYFLSNYCLLYNLSLDHQLHGHCVEFPKNNHVDTISEEDNIYHFITVKPIYYTTTNRPTYITNDINRGKFTLLRLTTKRFYAFCFNDFNNTQLSMT